MSKSTAERHRPCSYKSFKEFGAGSPAQRLLEQTRSRAQAWCLPPPCMSRGPSHPLTPHCNGLGLNRIDFTLGPRQTSVRHSLLMSTNLSMPTFQFEPYLTAARLWRWFFSVSTQRPQATSSIAVRKLTCVFF